MPGELNNKPNCYDHRRRLITVRTDDKADQLFGRDFGGISQPQCICLTGTSEVVARLSPTANHRRQNYTVPSKIHSRSLEQLQQK